MSTLLISLNCHSDNPGICFSIGLGLSPPHSSSVSSSLCLLLALQEESCVNNAKITWSWYVKLAICSNWDRGSDFCGFTYDQIISAHLFRNCFLVSHDTTERRLFLCQRHTCSTTQGQKQSVLMGKFGKNPNCVQPPASAHTMRYHVYNETLCDLTSAASEVKGYVWQLKWTKMMSGSYINSLEIKVLFCLGWCRL